MIPEKNNKNRSENNFIIYSWPLTTRNENFFKKITTKIKSNRLNVKFRYMVHCLLRSFDYSNKHYQVKINPSNHYREFDNGYLI